MASKNPPRWADYKNKAKEAEKAGDWGAAAKYWDDAISVHPDRIPTPMIQYMKKHRDDALDKAELLRNPKKRKTGKAKKRTGKTEKAKSARRAVNIRVNVLSKNPKKRKAKKQTAAAARRRSPRPLDRLKRKYSGRRFVICAHTRGGKRFYETAERKFSSDRKKARVFPTFAGASKEAHKVLGRMPESVKSLNVEFAK